jgi:large subunit ribosomal protein L17
MKKLKKGRKLKRNQESRKALFKSLATAIVLKEKIITTEAKAKEIKPFLEKLITAAKKNDLASKKKIHSIFSDQAAKKIINKIAPKYASRKGGYLRIIKLGFRKNDAAKIARIEFV